MVVFLWCGDDVLVVSLMEVSRMDNENNSVFGFVGPISVFCGQDRFRSIQAAETFEPKFILTFFSTSMRQ